MPAGAPLTTGRLGRCAVLESAQGVGVGLRKGFRPAIEQDSAWFCRLEADQMKTVTTSKEQVDAGEIEWHVADDRKRHTRRGYAAVVFVTVLGGISAIVSAGDNLAFEALKGATLALIASGITAAIINSERDIYYRRATSLRMEETAAPLNPDADVGDQRKPNPKSESDDEQSKTSQPRPPLPSSNGQTGTKSPKAAARPPTPSDMEAMVDRQQIEAIEEATTRMATSRARSFPTAMALVMARTARRVGFRARMAEKDAGHLLRPPCPMMNLTPNFPETVPFALLFLRSGATGTGNVY